MTSGSKYGIDQPPVGEAPVGVLLGAARCLHDAVQAHELVDHNSHPTLLRLGF
jgi:hypothetical protein